MRPGYRLGLLALAHLASGVLLGGYCAAVGGRLPGFALPLAPLVTLLALALGQACLLGFWAALSRGPRWLRLGGLAAGAVYLEALVSYGLREDDLRLVATISVATISVVSAAALLAARRGRAELRRVVPAERVPPREGLRFSIRGLMLTTLIVATLLGGARGVRQAFGHFTPSLFASAVLAVSLVVLALAAGWAALGVARPAGRACAVLACAVAYGGLFAYGVSEDRDWEPIAYFVIVVAGQSAAVLASLLVARSAGYRLVAAPRPT